MMWSEMFDMVVAVRSESPRMAMKEDIVFAKMPTMSSGAV